MPPLCVSIALTLFLGNFASIAWGQPGEAPVYAVSAAEWARMQNETLELVARACPRLILPGGADEDNHMSVPELARECSRELKTNASVLSPEDRAAMDFLELACPELYARLAKDARNHITLTDGARECDRKMRAVSVFSCAWPIYGARSCVDTSPGQRPAR